VTVVRADSLVTASAGTSSPADEDRPARAVCRPRPWDVGQVDVSCRDRAAAPGRASTSPAVTIVPASEGPCPRGDRGVRVTGTRHTLAPISTEGPGRGGTPSTSRKIEPTRCGDPARLREGRRRRTATRTDGAGDEGSTPDIVPDRGISCELGPKSPVDDGEGNRLPANTRLRPHRRPGGIRRAWPAEPRFHDARRQSPTYSTSRRRRSTPLVRNEELRAIKRSAGRGQWRVEREQLEDLHQPDVHGRQSAFIAKQPVRRRRGPLGLTSTPAGLTLKPTGAPP